MRDLKWFDSLSKRDFDNGVVLDEIAKVFKFAATVAPTRPSVDPVGVDRTRALQILCAFAQRMSGASERGETVSTIYSEAYEELRAALTAPADGDIMERAKADREKIGNLLDSWYDTLESSRGTKDPVTIGFRNGVVCCRADLHTLYRAALSDSTGEG